MSQLLKRNICIKCIIYGTFERMAIRYLDSQRQEYITGTTEQHTMEINDFCSLVLFMHKSLKEINSNLERTIQVFCHNVNVGNVFLIPSRLVDKRRAVVSPNCYKIHIDFNICLVCCLCH